MIVCFEKLLDDVKVSLTVGIVREHLIFRRGTVIVEAHTLTVICTSLFLAEFYPVLVPFAIIKLSVALLNTLKYLCLLGVVRESYSALTCLDRLKAPVNTLLGNVKSDYQTLVPRGRFIES